MFTLSIPRRRKAGVMNRTHRRPGPSRYRLSFHAAGMLVVCFALSSKGTSADLHVDPNQGQDSADGITSPVKTIAAAIRQSNPGDTIHLMPNLVYRDWAAFFDKSGESEQPITLDGHGATLDGCDPLDPIGWLEVEPGLFRNDDLMPLTDAIIDRWFFVMGGQLHRMNRCSKGPSESFKAPEQLIAGEWTFLKDAERTQTARAGYIFGSFWIKLPPNLPLADAMIEVPVRGAGVLIRGPNLHLWKDATWRGFGNWYDLDSARVDRVWFAGKDFESFCQAVTKEQDSCWKPATNTEVIAAGIGTTLRPTPASP